MDLALCLVALGAFSWVGTIVAIHVAARRRAPRDETARDVFLAWARSTRRTLRAHEGGIVALGPASAALFGGDDARCWVRVSALGTRHRRELHFHGAPSERALDAIAREVELHADRELGRAPGYR